MRLLIAYPNPFTFSETFVRDHIKFLEPIETLTDGWLPYVDKEGKSIFKFPFSINVIRGFVKRYFPNLYHSIYTSALKKYLKEKKIDHVLTEYGLTATNMCAALSGTNIKMTAHFHGFDAHHTVTVNKYKDKYVEMMKYINNIIVVSEDMKSTLISYGIDAHRIHVNSCGVDTSKFIQMQPHLNDKVFIFTGRFTGKKSPINTIKAFNIVLQKHSDAKLKMIGSGELFDKCVQLINELGISNSIELLGVKTPEEIIEHSRTAKIFVQHSMITPEGDSEGTPVALLEAASMGLPVVSTKHAGIKQAVVHAKTGYLVDEGDYEQMAKYMIELLESNDKVEEFGANARAHMIQNYTMTKQIENIKSILQL